MDWVTPITNQALERIIEGWLLRSLEDEALDRTYCEALADVFRLLWPVQGEEPARKGKAYFLPLPSLCGQALDHLSTITLAVNVAWVLLYIASYLLDKVEDGEFANPIFCQFRPGAVVNLTSGLLLHAERILDRLEPDTSIESGGATETLAAVRRSFHQYAFEVCAGQHLDLTIKEPSFRQGWNIVEAKSGKFFAMGAYLGARLATQDAFHLETFTEVGQALGIMIQITNDLHGLGKENETGSDLAQGKRTLPVLYALEVLPPAERVLLIERLRVARVDPLAEDEARKMIISAGVIVYLSLEAEKYRQKAENALNRMHLDPGRAGPLYDLINYAGRRTTSFFHPCSDLALLDTGSS